MSECLMCGGGGDHDEPQFAVVPAMGEGGGPCVRWVHMRCLTEAGGLNAITEKFFCCKAREMVTMLMGGCMVMKREGIPPDEIWYVKDKKAKRYRVLSTGGVLEVNDGGRGTREAAVTAKDGEAGAGTIPAV